MLALLPLHVFAQCYVFKNCRNFFENSTFFFREFIRRESIRQESSLFGKKRVYPVNKRVYSAKIEFIRPLNKLSDFKINSLNKRESIRRASLFGQFSSLFGESRGWRRVYSAKKRVYLTWTLASSLNKLFYEDLGTYVRTYVRTYVCT